MTADEALSKANKQVQYFWADADGAHVTTVPKETFLDNPTGGNALTDSDGLDVRDGETSLAKFGETTRIGQEEQSHVVIDYHSMQLKDKERNTYFHVSDLRDETGNAEITEYIYSDGGTNIISVKLSPITSVVALKINSADKLANVQSFSGNKIYLDYTMSSGAFRITVTYTTTYPVKAYTLGTRSTAPTETLIGPFSVCEGSGNFASNYNSHAEGSSTNSTGVASHAEGNIATADGDASHAEGFATNAREDYSHAEGYVTHAYGEASHAEGSGAEASGYASHAQNDGTTAGYDSQTAIGKYNSNKYNNAFEIGNGTADDARSNAFEVDWNGNTTASGTITAVGHSSPIGTVLYEHLTSDMSVSPSTGTAICSIDLPKGTWQLIGYVRFPSNNSGVRRACIDPTSGANYIHVQQTATQGGVTQMQVNSIVEVTATSQLWYLNVWHNSTSPLTMPAGTATGYTNGIRAVRIA